MSVVNSCPKELGNMATTKSHTGQTYLDSSTDVGTDRSEVERREVRVGSVGEVPM